MIDLSELTIDDLITALQSREDLVFVIALGDAAGFEAVQAVGFSNNIDKQAASDWLKLLSQELQEPEF